MQTLLFALLFATAAADTPEPQPLYVLGSSLNLREQPSTEAAVLEKLPIGTPCQVTERPEGTWLKVRCAEKEGYASASLLGTQKPSAEQFKDEARDTKRSLQQREDSALRASTLAPEDKELQELLGKIFFERNLKLVADLRKPVGLRPFDQPCLKTNGNGCIADAATYGVKDVKVRAETKGNLFVVAVGNAERVAVYRGRYKIDRRQQRITGDVIESTHFATTPVLDHAIFFDIGISPSDRFDLALGQFVPDEASQALLKGLSRQWAALEKDDESGAYLAQWNDCLKRSFLLTFGPDMHGRWLLSREVIDVTNAAALFWITAVSQNAGGLELTLENLYGGTTHELFKLPQDGDDIAFLGDRAYSFKLGRHAEQHHKCLEGGP